MTFNPAIHNRRNIRLQGYDYARAGMYFITICCAEHACWFGRISSRKGKTAEMVLNDYGRIAYNELLKLPERFPSLTLEVFQIMPNHLHMILELGSNTGGAGFTPALLPEIKNPEIKNPAIQNPVIQNSPGTCNNNEKGSTFEVSSEANSFSGVGIGGRAGVNHAPTIGKYGNNAPTIAIMVGSFKSLVALKCCAIFNARNETMGKLWQRNYYEHIIRSEQSYSNISDYINSNPEKWTEDKFYKENSNIRV